MSGRWSGMIRQSEQLAGSEVVVPPVGEIEAEVRALIDLVDQLIERVEKRAERRPTRLAWQAIEMLKAGNRDLFGAAGALAYDEADD